MNSTKHYVKIAINTIQGVDGTFESYEIY